MEDHGQQQYRRNIEVMLVILTHHARVCERQSLRARAAEVELLVCRSRVSAIEEVFGSTGAVGNQHCIVDPSTCMILPD